MSILVAGGTGMLGRLAVDALQQQGHASISVLSRSGQTIAPDIVSRKGDLLSGENLDIALAGVDSVIWCAHDREALANDALCMRNLLAACERAGVAHFVYTGIAGIETSLASPYYAGKLREEQAIEASNIGHTILRAAQFHTLVETVLEACDEGALLRVARPLLLRPVAPETVAQRLADLAVAKPAGRVRDLVGPEDRELADLARIWLKARNIQKAIVETDEVPPRWTSLQSLTHGPAERARQQGAADIAQISRQGDGDIRRNITGDESRQAAFARRLSLAQTVRHQQQRHRGKKIYSLHAPEVKCIANGNSHKPC